MKDNNNRKATNQELALFMVGWANAAQALQDDLMAYKAQLMQDIKEHNFRCDHSFEDFGKQALLFRLRQFYEHNEPIEKAIRDTKDIINKTSKNEG